MYPRTPSEAGQSERRRYWNPRSISRCSPTSACLPSFSRNCLFFEHCSIDVRNFTFHYEAFETATTWEIVGDRFTSSPSSAGGPECAHDLNGKRSARRRSSAVRRSWQPTSCRVSSSALFSHCSPFSPRPAFGVLLTADSARRLGDLDGTSVPAGSRLVLSPPPFPAASAHLLLNFTTYA